MTGDKGTKVSTKKADKKHDKKAEKHADKKVDKKADKKVSTKAAAVTKSSSSKTGVPKSSKEILEAKVRCDAMHILFAQRLQFSRLQKSSKAVAKPETSSDSSDEESSDEAKPAPKVTKANGKVVSKLKSVLRH